MSAANRPAGRKSSRSATQAVQWPWPLPTAAVLPAAEAPSPTVAHQSAAPKKETAHGALEAPAAPDQDCDEGCLPVEPPPASSVSASAGPKMQMMGFAPLEFSGRPVTELYPASNTTKAPAVQATPAQVHPHPPTSSLLSAKSGGNGLEQSFLTTQDHTCGMLAPPAFGKAAGASHHLSGASQLGRSGLAQSLLPFYDTSSGQASSTDDGMEMPLFPQLSDLLGDLSHDGPKTNQTRQAAAVGGDAWGSSSAGSARPCAGSAADTMQQSMMPFWASRRSASDAASSVTAKSLRGFYDETTAEETTAAQPSVPEPSATEKAHLHPAMLLPPPDFLLVTPTGDFSLRSGSSGDKPALTLTTPRGFQPMSLPTMPDSFEPVPETEAEGAADELQDTHAPENPFALPTFGACRA